MTDIAPDLPEGPFSEPVTAALFDTPEHAAVTSLVLAEHLCPDRVRSQSARVLWAYLGAAAAGEGGPMRKRASTLVTLVHCAGTADPTAAPMLHTFERWMLHPGRDTAAAMTAEVGSVARAIPAEVARRAWASGTGLDRALAEIDRQGLSGTSREALVVVAEAVDGVVPIIWLAERLCTSRDALHRGLRGLRDETSRR